MRPARDPAAPAIRPALPSDALAVARVQVAAWRDAYRGIVPQKFLDGMSEDRAAQRWQERFAPGRFLFVAEGEQGVTGFVSGGPAREGPGGFDGEVYALYVLAAERRRGIGGRLLRRAALALAEGRAFDERHGGRVVAAKEIEIGGADLPEVAYGWADLASLRGASAG